MPKTHTVQVTDSKARLPLKTTYIVVSNRGDASGHGDVELSFDNSNDTFLLLVNERQPFHGDFTHICYERAEDHKADKIRLDIFEA